MANLDIFSTLDRLDKRQDYLDDAATLDWIKTGIAVKDKEERKARQDRAEAREVERLGYTADAQAGLDISNQYQVWLDTIKDDGLSLEEIKGTDAAPVKGESLEEAEKRKGFQGAFAEFHMDMKEKYKGNDDALNFVEMYGVGVTEAYDFAIRRQEGQESLVNIMEQLRQKDYGSTVSNPVTVQDVVSNTQRAKDLAVASGQKDLAKALELLEARAINQSVVKAELRKYTHAPYSGMEGESETINLLKHPGRAAAYTGEIPVEDTDMVRSMEFFKENPEQYHKLKEVQLRAEQGDWIGAREKLDTFHQNVTASAAYKERLKNTLTAAKLKTDKEILEEKKTTERIRQKSNADQLSSNTIDFSKEEFLKGNDPNKFAQKYLTRLKSINEAVDYTKANWLDEHSTKVITKEVNALFDEIWRQEDAEISNKVFGKDTDLVARDDYETQAILLSGVGSVVDDDTGRGIRLNTSFGAPSDREFRWYKKFDENNKLVTITPLSEIDLSRIDTKRQADALEDAEFTFGDFRGAFSEEVKAI